MSSFNLEVILIFICTIFITAHSVPDLPRFSQMLLLYPGYYLHGGRYRDMELLQLVGGHLHAHTHNTASIRLSWMLNRLGGIHTIGTDPIKLSHSQGDDSYTGKDGQQYIFRNTAFGPYLAAKYGNPLVAKPDQEDHTKTMAAFIGKKGIVRLVSYQRHHASGHVALWDCDHFVQGRDWTIEKHMISVEFWEAPDSYCPQPQHQRPHHSPHLQKVAFSPALLANQLDEQEKWSKTSHHGNQRHFDVRHAKTRHQRHRHEERRRGS